MHPAMVSPRSFVENTTMVNAGIERVDTFFDPGLDYPDLEGGARVQPCAVLVTRTTDPRRRHSAR